MIKTTHYNVPTTRYSYRFNATPPIGTEYVKIDVDKNAVSADTGTVSVLLNAQSPGIVPSGGGAPVCLSDMILSLRVRRCTLSAGTFANTAGDSVTSGITGTVITWMRKLVPKGDDGVYGVNFKWPGAGAYKFEVIVRANEFDRPVIVTARETL